jgi:oligopeptide transport system ATP-binding protein
MAPLLVVRDFHVAVYDDRVALEEREPSVLWVADEQRELAPGWRAAVRGVSFQVEAGEVLAIIGESGSGKTLSALSAFNLNGPGTKVLSGTVELDGRTIYPLPKERMPRRRWRRSRPSDEYVVDDVEWRKTVGMQVGFLFQDAVTAWEPTTLIGDQSGEVLVEHTDLSTEEIEARVMDALGEVRLPKAQKYFSFAHELSRGQAQRAMLAAALIKAPRLLVADEPLSGLDTSVAAAILDLIQDLREKRGMAMIMITHDLATVAKLADRVAVMYGGQIMEEGDAASLFNQPLHPYTEGLLGSIPWPGIDRLRPIEGDPVPIIEVPGDQCAFAPRCPYAVDECRRRRPLLTPTDGGSVACIRAEELELRGVRG